MTSSRKKRVSVTFAGGDDAVQHILPLNQRKTREQVLRSRLSQSYTEDIPWENDDQSDTEKEDTDTDDVFKPSEALSVEDGVVGSKVYGFQTPKRAAQMAQRASESASAVTPKAVTPRADKSASRSQTPRSILKRRTQNATLSETGQTPSSKRAQRRVSKLAASTPHRLRARIREDSSSEDSLTSEDEEDSGSDISEESTVAKQPVKTKSTPVKTKSTPRTPSGKGRSRRCKDVDTVIEKAAVDAYFDAHSQTSVLTSDRTLSRLDTPQMDTQTLNSELTGFSLGYTTEREALYDEHKANFRKWMFQLCNGYNLLFHGLGSKRKLIEDFRMSILANFNHIVVNGYFPSLTIKNILNAITEEVLDHRGTFRTPIEQCDFIRRCYAGGDYEDFFLVVHNIDGAMLQPEKVQTVLSLLAQVRGVHIIASLDHINAPLIWDQTKSSRFNWLWYDVTTYEPYIDETSYENSLLVQQSGVLALSSLTHVMRSLTPNAKGIFLLLAKHQLENAKENPGYLGLAFPDLYQKCRESFLVNSDLTLRTQLTEFKDHKLIKMKKAYDGVDYLMIPLDEATLKEFLEQQEQES